MKLLARLFVSLLVFASCPSLAQDCSGPPISLTDSSISLDHKITDVGSDIYLAVSGIDKRGIIDPESGSGWLCDGDYGLVSAWFGVNQRDGSGQTIRTPREALEVANGGFVVDAVIEVCADSDGDLQCDSMGVAIMPESIRTNAKLTVTPIHFGARPAAMTVWGAIIEPGTLDPGRYLANLTYLLDVDCLPLSRNGNIPGVCDGVFDNAVPFPSNFEVLAVDAAGTNSEIIARLQSIVDDGRCAAKIGDALTKAKTALNEFTKLPPDNQAAMGNLEGAVGDLEGADNDGCSVDDDLTDIMDDLAGLARAVAKEAGAEGSLAEGDGLRTNGKYKDAVSKYRDALANVT